MKHTGNLFSGTQLEMSNNIAPSEKFLITPGIVLLNKPTSPQQYVVEGLVPRKAITLITGDSGHGKSLIMLLLVKHISSGTSFLNKFPTKNEKVLIIDQEMNENIIVGRVKAFFENAKDVEGVHFIYDHSFKISDESHHRMLVEIIKNNGYGVIVFDTFSDTHSGDDSSNSDMKKVNESLLKLIRETGVTIISLQQNNKAQYQYKRKNLGSFRGATEILAKVSSYLTIVQGSAEFNEETGCIVRSYEIAQEKARLPDIQKPFTIIVSYDKFKNKTSACYGSVIDQNVRQIDRAKKIITDLLSKDEELSVKMMMEKIDIGDTNIRSAFRALVAEGTAIERIGMKGEKFYANNKVPAK